MKKLLFLLMLLPLGLCAQVVEDESEVKPQNLTETGETLGEKVIIKPSRLLSSREKWIRRPQPLFKVHSSNYEGLRRCDVYAEVLECRKSNLSGSEGRLIIRPLYIKTKDGGRIYVHGDIYLRGLNRTNVKFWLGFIPFMWFVPGTGAKTASDHFTVYMD